MKTALKVLVSIIVIGIILSIIGLILIDFDFGKVSALYNNDEDYILYEENTDYEASIIQVEADNRRIDIKESGYDNINITYYQSEDDKVTYQEEDDKIYIEAEEERKFWFFNLSRPSKEVRTITIELPSAYEGILDIKTINGEIKAQSLGTVERLNLETTNGTINVKNISVNGTIDLNSTNGKIDVDNVSCYSSMDLSTSNGVIDVKGVVASSFEARVTNGEIDINSIDSNNITLSSVNGSIDINANGNYEDYEVEVETTNGEIEVQGVKVSSQTLHSGQQNRLKATTTNGSIDIVFS